MKPVGIVLILLAIGVFGYWGANGAHFATQYQVQKTKTIEDDFGDKVEQKYMADEFRFGLTPDKGYDGALPIGGGLGGLGLVLLVVGVVRGRKAEDPA